MKKHIPNSLTLLNLLCGCLGIICCFSDKADLVPLFIGTALLADFLDGFIARTFDLKSDLGAHLDSLADMVTFGVLPGIMLFKIMGNIAVYDIQIFGRYLKGVELIYVLFACVRLAKFNLDSRQDENFIGLATPAGCLFVLGLYGKFYLDGFNLPLSIYNSFTLVIIAFVLSYLMITEIPLFSMKGNPFSWKQNKMRVLFLISAIPQLILLKWLGLSTIIVSYVIFALLHNSFEKKTV